MLPCRSERSAAKSAPAAMHGNRGKRENMNNENLVSLLTDAAFP
jgi:hypothetical protein